MQQDISDIYGLATKTTGVFVNIALQEPFGLTLIEAAVHGAPIVATKHGGPVDIIKTLKVRAACGVVCALCAGGCARGVRASCARTCDWIDMW